MISRLPIRLRLTLPFALVMAVVLAATGFLIYRRVSSTLLSSIDRSLRGQALEAARRAQRGYEVVDRDAPDSPALGQVLAANGTVRSSTPPGLPPIIHLQAVREVVAGQTRLQSGAIPGRQGDWRILKAPGRVGGQPVAVVIASSLQQRDQALDRLVRELVLGGSLALLVATLAGYGLAASALRPVEAMRRRAASIGASTPGSRLPIPPSRDELSRLAETLNDMLARLEAAFEHERRFVDDASHELRTPLALLRAEVELALRHPRSREELERALRSAGEETERLSRLAEDLLLFARFDQGRLPLRRELLDVRDLLDEVAARYEAQAAARTVRVEAPSGLVVDGDEARLSQALGNLVENALSYGAGPVVLSAFAQNGRVELHVLDEGAGVAHDFLPRAFDRFSRADDARGGGGTGLGLPIVELIAKAHGGEAGLRNRSGPGADAWISIAAT
jgi:two-component system OmpR family sensor kinase